MLSETKTDETFPSQQFHVSNYKTFCRDRNKRGGELLFYINENIPCKLINDEIIPSDIEMIMFEFLVKTRKWLCIGLYKSPSQNENYFLDILSKVLSKQTCQYENVMLIGDFNLTVNNKNLGVFMNTFNLESLINKPTCFQSANPTCIDLILTNKKSLFKNSNVLEVGISDHHSFITTALRTQLIKGNAKMKMYRDYKTFNIDFFKRDLRESLENHTSYDYSCFQNIFIALLNKHAPIKKKIMRFNNNPFMSKALRKAIMHRSKLKNIYNNYRTEDNWANYKKQRNFCVNLLRKTKTEYFQKLNVKDLSDNRKFWKTMKPFFINKGLNSDKLMLKENNRLITEEKELVTVMNTFL